MRTVVELARRAFGLCGVMLVLSAASGMCAEDKKADDDIPSDFLSLADLRGSLTTQIATLDQETRELTKAMSDTASEFSAPRQIRAALQPLLAKAAVQREDRVFVDLLDRNLRSAEGDSSEARARVALRIVNLAELDRLHRRAALVEHKIATILTPEQTFKTTMSIAFAILIGAVIAGFFILAYIDQGIRQAIFSGEAGIQFLTLFSLVIAIILFGITGILEGKELAALLGGLSGYILGRVTQPTVTTKPA